MPANFGNFFNGIGISENDQTGFDSIVGCDVHSKPGTITCSKAMTRADSIVDALCTCRVTVPTGDTYFGATNGKIFKVTSAGVVSLVHTAPASAAVTGIGYFNTYLYYAYSNKLGRFDGASTWTDGWATFTNTHTNPRHMLTTNLSMYITDKYLIAAVDLAGTFSANVLDLDPSQIAVALAPYANGVLIGTRVANNFNQAGLFWWDTYSSSWTIDDYIDEEGVNAFIPCDNLLLAQIGTIGNIYYWSGSQAVLWGRLRDTANTVTTSVNPYAVSNLNGLPLFGTTRGIYSLGQSDAKLPRAKVIEYVPSQGQGTTIGALATVGNQVFSAYQNGSNYGVDKLSTNKYSGFFYTPIVEGKAKKIMVAYDSIPTGTSVSCQLDKDKAGFASHTVVKDDAKDRVYYSGSNIENKSTVQAKISMTASTTSAPTIRRVTLE